MASDFVRALLVEQRKRMVGGVLAHAEQSAWWPKLSKQEQLAFRDKVLSSTGVYHDVVLDCVKAAVGDGAVINEEALSLIRDLHDRQVRRERVG
jgi:hypothetical protein